MRYLMQLSLFLAWLGTAHALTPLPDKSSALFSGEWAGTGERGSYCYLKLAADGSGGVLVDLGSGDWLGARIQWRNQQQAIQVDKVILFPASAQLRIMPLEKFVISAGFNQSLKLSLDRQSGGCQLQRIGTSASQLVRARSAIDALLPAQQK